MTSDPQARRRALDPTRSFIVQAPAGSGKTELLTQRYLRLLATVEQPEQILAITFTRKAAAEMRNRILQAIEAAAGAMPDSAHKRVTWELARAVRTADAQRHWQLTEHPSRLRVQTIDALNAMLARRLPILAGTGSALEPTDDPGPLYEAACVQLIERLGDGSAESASLEALIVHLGNRVDRLVRLLMELLAKRDQWLHPVVRASASENLRTVLESTLRTLVDGYLARLCRDLLEERRRELFELARYAAGNLLADPMLAEARRSLLEACSEFDAVPGPDSRCLQVWQAIANMLFKEDGYLYIKVDIRHGFPPTNPELKARIQRVLEELAQDTRSCEQLAALRTLPHPAYPEDQWRILEALLNVLPVAVAELQLVFQSQGKADYVEGALRALRALGTPEDPTDLALAFDYRLRHVLVDEFQDTSFAQLDLLERLTAGWSQDDGRTLFCVGDPMQSIYRFRQAEVGLFLQLQRYGLRNVLLEPLELSANFRSAPTIVEWVNRAFPSVLSSENDPEQGAVKYSASTAAVDAGEGGGVHVHPLLNADETAEAKRVADIVRQALARDDGGTIAVLVTARTHVGLIAGELSAAGIGFQAIEIEQLSERPVVQDLIALTRALVHLADRTAWLAVLRAPWCGLTLADLYALAGNDRSATINDMLARVESSAYRGLSDEGRARVTRTYAVLAGALAERGRWPLRDWVERTWNALGGPATLSRPQDIDDAEAFFRRLDQIESVSDLEDVARLEEQLQRLFANPRAQGKARVEIMTIHKAKGLEFDTVILPALHRWMRGEDRELLRWTRIAGPGGGIVFAPIKAQGAEPDAIYRWIELLERQRTVRERGRLLYVAATRAKRDLHLLGSVQTKEEQGGRTIAEPRNGSLLQMLWHELKPAFEAAPSQWTATSSANASLLTLKRLPAAWQAPLADPPVRIGGATSVLDTTTQRLEFDWVSETSRHVGTLVHRELDRMVRAGVSTISSEAMRAARVRMLSELAELGVPPERCGAACERVVAAIEHTFADERGRWLLGVGGGISDAESELALTGMIEGRLSQIVIDRTFRDERGDRWIVDFKTSAHQGGGLGIFLSEEVERYRGQLTRYAKLMRMFRPGEPVRAALYFPLLKQWREVAVD